MLNTTQQNTCAIVQHNNAVNYCYNLQYNVAQQIAAVLKANKIAVRKATNAYCNNTACIVLRNAAQMQNALTIAKQVLAQNNIVCNKITVKKLTMHFYLQQHAKKVKLFTTTAKQHALRLIKHNATHNTSVLQQVQLITLNALQQHLQVLCYSVVAQKAQANFAVIQNSSIIVCLQSNTQQHAANALIAAFAKHNVCATVTQHTQYVTITLQ